jgi:uncharacterized protein (DUF1778 family)
VAVRQLNIRIGEDLAEQLKQMAAAEGLSLNELIVRVLAAASENRAATMPITTRFGAIEQRLQRIEQHLGLDP